MEIWALRNVAPRSIMSPSCPPLSRCSVTQMFLLSAEMPRCSCTSAHNHAHARMHVEWTFRWMTQSQKGLVLLGQRALGLIFSGDPGSTRGPAGEN